MENCDIAIVGGGMVGAALALALAKGQQAGQKSAESPLKIVVFEAFEMPQQSDQPLQPSYDARSTALSLGTRHLFERLGVWSSLAPSACPIRHIRVSDKGHFGAVRLDADKENVSALGYVVENRSLGRVLMQPLQQPDSGIEFRCPAEVVAARPTAQGSLIEYEHDGEVRGIEASLLVICDGGRSGLREQLHIDSTETPYEQCALIANLTLDRPHEAIAYERFTDQGPMALLPLQDDGEGKPRAALVWSVPLEQADELLAIDDDAFLRQLHRQFGYRAGRITRVGERHSYPLKLMRTREQVRRGVVVLGNAAHTLHPIAGQGFNLALRGAMVLAQELLAAQRQGRPLGGLETLNRFHDQLGWDQYKTIGFSDRATMLFSNDQSLLVMARNVGLLGMELASPLKHAFADSAMGLDVALPELGSSCRSQVAEELA
ncbi:2-octaprenyl-6-methoxyphenyl hydroxylase [Motiliproteus coralliicola]|uniref:2-octaprenyl-6-methoxyphenyl hydroxylase n=1 Tax=Motiliproteus coralliicola TaxID=2283196 RepID=A0A369W855_9GAMM|nr:2-octaprenyl-6-methoxyphenyl hydroxylase [Motiliproteus coralliicola]RDE18180.1 2-octaprenyl-6-methoxyphenyl hydroxylase [Motiliproteus coralliicola]